MPARTLRVFSCLLALCVCQLGCTQTNSTHLVDAALDDGIADASPQCPTMPTPMNFVPRTATRPLDDILRMNHVQAKATHNSYHIRPEQGLVDWAYTHVPLAEQFATQGVRGIELDVHWDSHCQRFEVYHLAGIDARTTCSVFTDCLLALREFSQAHPGHAPIFVHIEPKDGDAGADDARIQALEREVLAVFDPAWIITPDEVRGESATLAQAIAARGWPTLQRARGRILFYIQGSSALFRELYTHGHRDLEGRLMFVDSTPSDPFAAVCVANDPIGDATEIQEALAAGYLVRTRADADPAVARTNDRTRLNAALASGAQIVSTDFPWPIANSEYFVEIPGGMPVRCSPTVAPETCTNAALENPALLTRF